MAEFDYEYGQDLVIDMAEDPVVADTVSPQVLASERFADDTGVRAAMYPVLHEAGDGSSGLAVQFVEMLDRTSGPFDSIHLSCTVQVPRPWRACDYPS